MRGFCHFFAEKEKEKNPVEAGDLRPASGERGGRPELGEKVEGWLKLLSVGRY